MGLMSLLGAAGASSVPSAAPPIEDIIVTGQRMKPMAGPAASIDPGLLSAKIPNLLMAERTGPTQAQMGEVIPRKGMFGVKGTLRDILGMVGDAFLVNSGNKAIYMPHRQKEKLGDAMYGYTQAPEQATERASLIDPEFAQKAWQEFQDNKVKEAQIAGLQDYRNDQTDLKNEVRKDKVRQEALRLLSTVREGDAESLKYAQATIRDYLTSSKSPLTPEQLGFDFETMTPSQAAQLGRSGMNSFQQARIPLDERRTVVAERNATSNETSAGARNTQAAASMINAKRPRPGPAGRGENSSEERTRIANMVDKIGYENLSPGQRMAADKILGTGSKGGLPVRSRRAGAPAGMPALPPGYNMRPAN